MVSNGIMNVSTRNWLEMDFVMILGVFIYSDMHMYSYTSKETVHKCNFWNDLKWYNMGSNRLQLFVIHLHWCQGVLIQIWSKNLDWPWNARTWNLKHLFFFVLLCKILEKCKSVTFMVWHFEDSEYFLPNFNENPLTSR